MNNIAKDSNYVLKNLGCSYRAKYEVVYYDGDNHVVVINGHGLVGETDYEYYHIGMLTCYKETLQRVENAHS